MRFMGSIAEYQIVAQQLDVPRNSRCQLRFACTHCDACAQSIAFVLIRIVCPRGGISIELPARKLSSQHPSLARIPQSPATRWLCMTSYRRRWFSKSLTEHHNIFKSKKSRPPGLVPILSARAAHHLRLTSKSRDHLANWTDANSHVVAGLLRV
jgi:hypothetical protein